MTRLAVLSAVFWTFSCFMEPTKPLVESDEDTPSFEGRASSIALLAPALVLFNF
jgi:hypothetical protein